MALVRLQGRKYKFYLAHPLAFADWKNPTAAEMNANPDNDPHGLIFNVTCALDVDGTQFDLGDPDVDDSTSFCQEATDEELMSDNAEIVFEFFRATEETRRNDPTKWNSAHLAFTLMAWRGIEYFAIMTVGNDYDDPIVIGDELKMAGVATDWGTDVIGTGESIRMNQPFAFRGNLNWNYEVVA